MEFIANMACHMADISTCFFSDMYSHVIEKQPLLSFPLHVGTEPVPEESVSSYAASGTFGPELPGMLTTTGWPTEGTPCQPAVNCNNLITNTSGTRVRSPHDSTHESGREATEAHVRVPQTAGKYEEGLSCPPLSA